MPVGKATWRWFYDHIACHYYDLLLRWSLAPFGGEARVRRELLEPVTLGHSDRILDLCCGTGTATLAIASKAGSGAEVVGLDLSVQQVRRARAKNRHEDNRFVVGDATATPFPAASFDKVLITHSLHEMLRSARIDALTEARRLLRPDGELAVLELDEPRNLLLRAFCGLWWFYWLPLNFETPTRRDMFRHGLLNEVAHSGFRLARRVSIAHGALQTVVARR